MSKKKNSFSFFLEHYIEEQRQNGRIMSKRNAVEMCGPLWTQMPEDKKQIYIDLAKAFKNEHELVKNKVSQQWVDPFCMININGEKATTANEITYLTTQIRNDKALRTHNFYIIHCNYYCRLEEGFYLPGEIALAEFNLEQGIRQVYHTLINPGKIPLGYAYEVKRIIEEVHGLPIPPHDMGEGNLDKIFTDVLNFMKSVKENEDEYPPLFTTDDNVQASTKILGQLSQNSRFHFTANVYPLHRMFFWLKNKCTEYCGNEPGFPVLSNALTEIEKDVFRYCMGISCRYHSELQDKFQNCSLSYVQRLVYIICDHCCCHLKIKLIRGKHVHQNFIKKTSDNALASLPSELSDLTSNPHEESDFCGASTYASSVVDDYRSLGKDSDGEENGEENSSVRGWYDREINADDILKNIRGRGKSLGNVEQKVGLPPS